ncbi:hypothetical protein KC622_02245 [Candidatus Dojkabacteria bacterium]|uniref:Nucleoside 2-deoxyribosyltransferase n=1 Tax=Candidatus Dojkabacteria bacterium TaxID=2099670 RepID=A0A955I1Z5_9BACT|nr:hypothetical protein [Candidatus Dojkabacteria bacterium]
MKAAIFGSLRYPELKGRVKMIEDSLVKLNVSADTSYLDLQIKEMTTDLNKTYEVVKRALHKNDIIIVENTKFSTGIGLIIGRVMELRKPLLVLFDKNHATNRGYSILVKAHGTKLNKVVYSEYTEKTLDQTIEDFVQKTKGMLNSKYLFNLSPEMAKYLQWSSEHNNIPMVDILRELLESKMSSDSVWNKENQ